MIIHTLYDTQLMMDTGLSEFIARIFDVICWYLKCTYDTILLEDATVDDVLIFHSTTSRRP